MIKKIKFVSLSLLCIVFAFYSCKSLNYKKEEDLKTIKMPFEESDYRDNSSQFYSIQNAVGENMNLNRSRALTAAKADLSGKIKTIMGNLANQELEFTNGNERESFDQKSTSISQQSMSKILKVDSKTLRQKDGKKYDYWVVYTVELDDVVALINANDLGFIVNNETMFKELSINAATQ